MGIQGQFNDRPTITYTPLTGQQYMKGILTPIAPSSVLFLIQAGYAADLVLSMTVESIKGLANRSAAHALGVDKSKKEATLLTFHRRDLSPELQSESAEFERLLQLDPNTNEYKVSYGMTEGGGSDIEMATRSVAQIMLQLAGGVDIPQAHLDEKNAYPVPPGIEAAKPLMHVHSGTGRSRPVRCCPVPRLLVLQAMFNFADTCPWRIRTLRDIAPDNAISTRSSRFAHAAGMVHRLPPPAVYRQVMSALETPL